MPAQDFALSRALRAPYRDRGVARRVPLPSAAPPYYRASHPQGVQGRHSIQPKVWRSDAPWLVSPNYYKNQRRLA